jgi:flagellar basal body P-ring protein FlgI
MTNSNKLTPAPFASENGLLKIGRRVFLAGAIVASLGCQNMIRRGQSPEELPAEVAAFAKYDKKLTNGPRAIGEICGLYGLDSLKVHGISLATELKSTGSAPIESGQRAHLERELKLRTSGESIDKLMSSKDTELVIIEGMIPPGAREGDTFDLEVVTMADSTASSIENGLVLTTRMRKMAHLGNRVTKGGISATAKGRVVVNAVFDSNYDDSADKKAKHLHGYILGGGKATADRPLSLRIRGDKFNQKTALQIARALNTRFQRISRLGRDGVAEPKNDRIIEIQVPRNYRNNIGRYASTINQMMFAENAKQRQQRLSDLETMISEPANSALASLQLEGLGKEALPTLKRALGHNDSEARFHAAEALAYMGEGDGIDELKHAAESNSSFRWHAFAALAALEGRESAAALTELLGAEEPEIRYGAFRAIIQQNPEDPIVAGDWLAGGFHLHEIDTDASPLIHFSTKKRPEIVVFGKPPTINSDFLYVESGLTIRGADDETLSLTAYSAEFEKEQRTCANEVVDLIRALADLGYGYSHQAKVLLAAEQDQMLSAQIAINATPKLDNRRRMADSQSAKEKGAAAEKPTRVSSLMNLFKR